MYVTCALLVGLAVLGAGCGGEEKRTVTGPNQPRFPEAKRPVALAVDRLQDRARAGDAKAICDDLLTKRFAARLGRCIDVVEEQMLGDDASLRVDSIRVRQTLAYAQITEGNGNVSRVRLRRVGADWRIDAIQPQRSR